MSDDRVVSLNGEKISTGEPCEYTVACLENILERARSGEVVGVVAVGVGKDDAVYTFRAGSPVRHSVIGGLTCAAAALSALMNDPRNGG